MPSDTNTGRGFRATFEHLLLPASVLMLTTAAFILTKAARDALYFERSGFADLPWAYLGLALLAWPVAMVALKVMRRFGPGPGRSMILFLVMLLNLALAVIARPGGGLLMTLAFIAVPLSYGVALSIGWLLGAELLSGTDINRPNAYGFLGSASMGGGVIGAVMAGWLAPAAGPSGMFSIGAVMLGAAVIGAHRASSGAGALQAPERVPVSPRPRQLAGEPYTLWLLILAGLGGGVGMLIEFQFYLAATETTMDQQTRTEFFAGFYTLLMLSGLALQLFMVPKIQERIGVRRSLMVLPLVLLAAGGALAFGSTLIGYSGLRVAEGGLRSSIHRSNWEQVYLPFENGLRDAAKLLVDGLGARFAEGVTALLLLAWVHTRPSEQLVLAEAGWIAYAVAAGALLWLVTLWRVRIPVQHEDRIATSPGIPECCVVTATLGKRLGKPRASPAADRPQSQPVRRTPQLGKSPSPG